MFAVYLVCAIVGGGLVLFQLVAGDSGSDTDVDVDADIDADIDAEIDAGGGDADLGSGAGRLLQVVRFSSIVFFVAFFGIAGVVLTVFGAGFGVALVASIIVALVAAVVNSIALSVLRSGQSSSHLSHTDFVGRRATVTVPFGAEGLGRVRVSIAGRPKQISARKHDAGEQIDVGADVVVIRYRNGTAWVQAAETFDDVGGK